MDTEEINKSMSIMDFSLDNVIPTQTGRNEVIARLYRERQMTALLERALTRGGSWLREYIALTSGFDSPSNTPTAVLNGINLGGITIDESSSIPFDRPKRKPSNLWKE